MLFLLFLCALHLLSFLLPADLPLSSLLPFRLLQLLLLMVVVAFSLPLRPRTHCWRLKEWPRGLFRPKGWRQRDGSSRRDNDQQTAHPRPLFQPFFSPYNYVSLVSLLFLFYSSFFSCTLSKSNIILFFFYL